MRIKPGGKIVLLILAIGVALGAWKFWQRFGSTLAPSAKDADSVVPKVPSLPTNLTQTTSESGGTVTLPGDGAGCTDKPPVKLLGYAWNAQMGLLFANGGPQATTGSLMCSHGVNLTFERQDDNGKLTEALVAFATDLSRGNANPTSGAHFVTIMGDGGAAFLKGANDVLRRLGPDYEAKVVGACGFSRGEDKLMGPADWKNNPTASRGGLVAGVIRDGDWNIAQKWLGENNLRTNPDEKTWDPDALNWVNASDYIDAAQKYIAGYSEDRPVVRNGKRTGETKHVVVNGVVTWTPGDVNVAQKKGGLVSIVSTREYASQMPCIIIGIDKWMKANREIVSGMLAAIGEGGDAVKGNTQALHKAAQISATVYHDAGSDAAYWEKYYTGTKENDATGVTVELGGSVANNLADSLSTFGLLPNTQNLFAATYTAFGDIVKAQYPNLVPNYYPVSEIQDTSYLQAIARNTTIPIKPVTPPHYDAKAPLKTQTSRRDYNIRFDTGKATFAPDAQKVLEGIKRGALIASGLAIEIHGHTDNVGSADRNMALSEARAFAVKKYLEKGASSNFPTGRVRVVAEGQTNPVAPNTSEAGRAQNRRVEIIFGTTR